MKSLTINLDIGIDQARFHPELGLAVKIPDKVIDLCA